jgi:2-dehydro-3-deoxyphosphogluconate aldolase/(4S)-4-hydroxy-2-oxoglutarate aldolase
VLGFELAHVGINANGAGEAFEVAGVFSKLFSFEQKEGNSSTFAGSAVEVMKGPVGGCERAYRHQYQFNRQSARVFKRQGLRI